MNKGLIILISYPNLYSIGVNIMKKFIATLLLVGALGFVGCGEKTNEEKANDAKDDATEAVDDAAAKAKEALK